MVSCVRPMSRMAQLTRVGEGKAECFVARIEQKGKSLDEYLQDIVTQALKKLPVPKLMRWGDSEHQFVRPVHGLIVLHGKRVVKAEVLGLTSGNVTSGHRFMCSEPVTITHADDYEATLARDGRVVASFAQRRESIVARLDDLSEQNASIWVGHANFDLEKLLSMSNEERSVLSTLLDEVTGLVEWPEVYVGEFEKEYLDVPQECLILTMQQNQKYFPLLDASTGKLLNKFLIVSNMQVNDPHHIIEGNERVVRPRLSDARFFFNQDRKQKLESRVEKLGNVVYHNKLGSQLQRVERITTLAGTIARLLEADKAKAELAARLCKADLLTDMVGEFPELQGIIGRYYAFHDGEELEVANAIEAHYHPRFAGDSLPMGAVACSVALADKLETIVGIYGIGQVPTGDKDPFGLRRQALGILRILIETPLDLPLPALLKATAENFPKGMLSATVAADVEGFMMDRLRGYLRDRSFDVSHIEAVLAVLNGRLHEVLPRLQGVRDFRRDGGGQGSGGGEQARAEHHAQEPGGTRRGDGGCGVRCQADDGRGRAQSASGDAGYRAVRAGLFHPRRIRTEPEDAGDAQALHRRLLRSGDGDGGRPEAAHQPCVAAQAARQPDESGCRHLQTGSMKETSINPFFGRSLRCAVLAPSPTNAVCLGRCAPCALRCIPKN